MPGHLRAEGNTKIEQDKIEINSWKTFFRVIKYSAREKRLFATVLLLTFAITGLNLYIPYLFSQFFNLAQDIITGKTSDQGRFLVLGALYLLANLSQTTFSAIDNYMGYKWWIKTQMKAFRELYGHLNMLSLRFYEDNPTGKIRERMWSGSQGIVNILDYVFMDILPQFIFLVVSVTILLFVEPLFAYLIIFIAPFYYLALRFFQKRQRPIRKDSRLKWEKLSTLLTESIYNVRTVKTNAKEGFHEKKIHDASDDAYGTEKKWAMFNGGSKFTQGLIIDFAKVFMLVYGFYMVSRNEMQIGTFILVWSYVNRALEPIASVARQVTNVQKHLVDADLMFSYLDTEIEINDTDTAINKKFNSPSININNITFGYANKTNITNLNLIIPGGKTVAIVGKSGSGKSTLIKLLLRLYEPQKGEISINNIKINELKQKSLRDNIAVVMQDSVIFNDTATNNIRYARSSASLKEVVIASKQAGADSFISKMPEKYNTILGEKGVKLSGGEQQRVNIARAFLKNAPILILDEATSSLDSEVEKEIQDSMWKLAEGKTTIIIAHRLSTVMRADLIVVMDKGKIVETGTHKDLVEGKGIYARLFEIQSGGYLK